MNTKNLGRLERVELRDIWLSEASDFTPWLTRKENLDILGETLPPLWNRLWEMLPGRSRVGASWQPPPPLILAAWHDTPAMLKMLRLAEHIDWAAEHESLDSVGKFLRELREDDWYHIGD